MSFERVLWLALIDEDGVVRQNGKCALTIRTGSNPLMVGGVAQRMSCLVATARSACATCD